jgi:hypothetical protein
MCEIECDCMVSGYGLSLAAEQCDVSLDWFRLSDCELWSLLLCSCDSCRSRR